MNLLEQFRAAKSQVPAGVLLLFRVGDFYEAIDEDAKAIAKALDLTVTICRREGGPWLMAGFPYHALESYLGKLLAAGHRVAIAEMVKEGEKPKVGNPAKVVVTEASEEPALETSPAAPPPPPASPSLWTEFKFSGKRFLAVRKSDGVHVIDEAGHNFGAWQSVESFRKRQRKGDEIVAPIGVVELTVRHKSDLS